MNRLVYVVSFLFLLAFQAKGNAISVEDRTEIDSLLSLLPKSSPDHKIEIFLELSNRYLSFSTDSSREYALLALSLAKEINNQACVANVYKMLGNIYYYQGNNNRVIGYYDSSLAIYNQMGDSSGMAKVWNNLGIIYQQVGDYEKSIDYHMKSLTYKTNICDTIGIISSCNNIGSIYYDLGEYLQSEEQFLKAKDLAERVRDYKNLPNILNNLGLINQELNHFKNSIEILQKALSACAKLNDQPGMATAYHNLGKSYFLSGEFQQSLDHYFEAEKIYERIGVKNSQTLNNIGQVYIELDYYQEALNYLKKALKVAKENNQFVALRDIYNNLAIVYDRLEQYDKAYSNYILFNQYDDSIKNQIFSQKVQNIYNQTTLENERKEMEKIRLETMLILEKKDSDIRRRNFLIYSFVAGFIFLLVIALILLKLFRQKTKANELLRQQNEEIVRSDNIIKKINKALTENEEMLRSIFDASPYSIVVIDNEATIIDCNNTCLMMFGAINKREILNKKMDQLFVPDQLSAVKERLKVAFETAEFAKHDYAMVRKDGSTFNSEITGGLIKDNSGNYTACVLIITDITERLHFIENLKHAKAEAVESDRLKTAFLANMSHEIRTPMNSIIGFSNLLSEPELKPDKKEQYLQHILQSSNLLLNLIDDIIDISKIEAGQININLVECNINEIVKDLFYATKATMKNENIDLRLNLPNDSEEYSFKTDPFRLRQILTNLLGNAIKFTEKGFVELGYKILKNDHKRTIEFYIKDSGIGIAKNKQEIIFERFRQVDDSRTRKFGGTGLGLAISKRLVDLLGGGIWVESEIGEGSNFHFTLPFENGHFEEVIQSEPFNGIKYEWKDKTILVAEDENSNFELLKASINRTKVRIIRAMNGEEAVDYVKRNDHIDLVLMDIRMPRLNGYDATRQIKLLKPHLPVISITAYAMSEDETKSIEAGCDMYISKPIRPSNLLTLLNEFLGSG